MKRKLILSSIAAIILGLAACKSTETMSVEHNDQIVVIPKLPQRIVVMNYGALDTLDALGKRDLVVGTSLTAIPHYLTQYNNAHVINTGNMKEPNLDLIKNQHPDLIIIGGRQAKRLDQLSQIAPVINLETNSANYVESTKSNITLLGQITGTQDIARKSIQALEAHIQQAQQIAQASHKNAIVALHNDGKVILTNAGARPALIYDVLKIKRAIPSRKHVSNFTEKPTMILIDNDYIATHKPNIIFIVDRSQAIGQKALDTNHFDNNILAKAGTKIVYLTADLWYLSGGGIESLTQQINEVIEPLK